MPVRLNIFRRGGAGEVAEPAAPVVEEALPSARAPETSWQTQVGNFGALHAESPAAQVATPSARAQARAAVDPVLSPLPAPIDVGKGITVEGYSPELVDLGRQLFEREMSPADFARLAAAPEGSTVKLYRLTRTQGEALDTLSIGVAHPDFLGQNRRFTRAPGQAPRVLHNNFVVRPGAPVGTGTRALARAVLAYLDFDFTHIDVDARQGLYDPGDPKSQMGVGAVVWPKLGFDKVLKRTGPLGHGYRKARTLLELHAMPGGAEAWARAVRRGDHPMTFSLEEGSLSRQVLRAALEAHGYQVEGMERL